MKDEKSSMTDRETDEGFYLKDLRWNSSEHSGLGQRTIRRWRNKSRKSRMKGVCECV